ncbi:GNAT family N-acetyltransferase [Candidatus Beckwithbacteria bacterium]|nr:GNAT family N-acetyltransferase [Candidatus Beckwithbacteria bacterium]
MIKIRLAQSSDLQAIQELNHQLFLYEEEYFDSSYNTSWPYSKIGEKYFKDSLNSNLACTLVALDNEKIIAYLIAWIYRKRFTQHRKCGGIAEIENIFVLSEYRGKNVGSNLIKEFEVWAKSKKVKLLKVVPLFKNTKAQNFYHQNGFEEHELVLEKKL